MKVTFTVPGRICGKGRPRFVRATGRTYTPAKTVSSEAVVKHFAAEAMKGIELLEGPLALSMAIYLTPPPSWSQKRRMMARFVTGKPDCDNSLKLASDAMNGIVFRDDSQITDIHFTRRYTLNGGERVVITVQDAIALEVFSAAVKAA